MVAPQTTIWLCPGQGAQKVGMAKDLAERFPEARRTLQAIDETLGFALSRLMFAGPEDELTATQNAQPAILAHSAAVFAVVGPKVDGAGVAAAGHSLGEYSAYIAAGALAPTDAAALVRRRGELMQQAGTERPGTMAAVLGLATAEVEAACRADCGCASGFANSNRSRNSAPVAGGSRPLSPTNNHASEFRYHRIRILETQCRQGAPRGPPTSFFLV